MSCGAKSRLSSANLNTSTDLGARQVPTWLGRIAASANRALQRRQQRNALLELDDRRLHDIGLTRKRALEECRKPLWR
jgi:uncharacterized protein YjiS (DUF1127 family)